MYGAPLSSTLSFSKVLNGLSKTLTVANQVLPLYQQAKPLINNLGSVKTILSTLTKDANTNNSTTKNTTSSNTKGVEKIEEVSIPNLPTFFR